MNHRVLLKITFKYVLIFIIFVSLNHTAYAAARTYSHYAVSDLKLLRCEYNYSSRTNIKNPTTTTVPNSKNLFVANSQKKIAPFFYIDEKNKKVYDYQKKLVKEADVNEHSISIRNHRGYENNDIVKMNIFYDRYSGRSGYNSYTTKPYGNNPFGMSVTSKGSGNCMFTVKKK